MKPNGRRRFRKMNARFRQRGSEVVRERARSTSAGKARKLILNDFWGGDPLPLPPPVFSPRSLVGMTMGARKRAARACPGCIECLNEIPSVDNGVRCDSSGAFAVAPARLRTKYRLGERLRLCPGKHGCRNCTRTCGACEDQFPDDTRCRRCGSVMTTEGPYCDGAGVIPARPQVNASKALAVEPADDLG